MNAAELHRLARDVRTIALRATENTGPDRVNAGELSVLEDIARNPGATVSEITRRTGLAQSLVSRISRAMADAGAISITPDTSDRRKVRIDLTPHTRSMILDRANKPILEAIAASTPKLSPDQQLALEHHLSEAEKLLRIGVET
ncbi:MarR family transcriptional regulator [Paenarthrobacter sp. Z7-10]|uniref:MarR family winged helix-turn-helix transcriptional regulator n=1 Tax=Paenarthrobacter sp. Z7-10 TaxID=2787635 RepID=UPI0022A97A91|nr:MarR family transcriptional regulator [Paenarthrobacter sp. Z7-10]MCZ2404702.1 MarR family transcriptional regulator [Paenarthrobacter sp. Z7-10]